MLHEGPDILNSSILRACYFGLIATLSGPQGYGQRVKGYSLALFGLYHLLRKKEGGKKGRKGKIKREEVREKEKKRKNKRSWIEK